MEDKRKFFRGIIPPPVVFLTLVIMGFLAHRLFPLNLMFHKWSTRLLTGIPLFMTAGLIAVNTLIIMRKNKTAISCINPTTTFIVTGPFRFTRNPLYLSLLLVMGTIAVLANSGWHFIALLVLFLFFNFCIVPREEKYLENRFGDDYLKYKTRVRRWI